MTESTEKFIRLSAFEYLFRPLSGGAPSLIVIFALGLTIAAQAGLLGLALGIILTSWFWKYAFILFDYTARGVKEPPALDIQMMNPVDEQRPLALLLILCAMYGVCHALSTGVGARSAMFVGSIFAFCLPATTAVLALECNILPALNPLAWVKLIAQLGSHYLLVLAVTAGYGLLLKWVWTGQLWLPVQLAISLFCSLSMFSLLAGLLYEQRDRVGLEVWHSPERTRARQESEDLKESAKAVDEAYGQMRSGKHIAAWKLLADWLESRQHRLEDYAWLCQRVESWGDDRYRTRLLQEYLDKLLAANQNAKALSVTEQALRGNKEFRPKSGTSTLRLAHIAASGGAPRTARLLIEDFPARFANDTNARAAEALLARINAQGAGAP